MGRSVDRSWFVTLSCLLFLGAEVECDCTEENMGILGGNYTLTKNLERGSLLIYRCPEGYYPYPTLTRVCQPNGRWKPAPMTRSPQKCKTVECPDPVVALQNGNVFPPQEQYFVGNETTYECYSGYTMRGSSSRTCLPNGKWSGSTTICSRDSGDACADPGIPPGASRTENMFGIDDKVTYTCNGNMFLVGSSERVCLESGQWTGQEPACYYKHTYDTPLEASHAFGRVILDSLAIVESLSDVNQDGRAIVSKTWPLNIYIAVDISESIEEKLIEKARDAVLTLIKKIASFSVSPNYEIIFFSSEIYRVANILDFFAKKIELQTVIQDLENFIIDGKSTGANLNLPLQHFEQQMTHIRNRVGTEGFKEHRHILILFSDGAYNLGGSPLPTVERIKNMVYMNQQADQQTQSRDDYLDIFVFAIGPDIFDDDLQPLTAGNGVQHYFRMKDITALPQTFDQVIDESEVGLCGLHQENETTADPQSSRRKYPWLVFVINKQANRMTFCLGSLVSPDFVLTTASCMPLGNTAANVVVKIEDGSEKKVKQLKIHPKYNIRAKIAEGVPEFYDYDLALLQLEEPVQISKSVRPICIPCTQETSDALNLLGESTCRQQEELLLRRNRERLNFLTKMAPLVAEKVAYAKLGENRSACIEKALNAPGISARDPRIPVTDNFLCTGGRSGQKEHIACAGDSGGAVFKNYELRTVQIGVVSWGTHNLCGWTDSLVESSDESRDFHINLFKMVPFLKEVLGDDSQDYRPLKFLKS